MFIYEKNKGWEHHDVNAIEVFREPNGQRERVQERKITARRTTQDVGRTLYIVNFYDKSKGTFNVKYFYSEENAKDFTRKMARQTNVPVKLLATEVFDEVIVEVKQEPGGGYRAF